MQGPGWISVIFVALAVVFIGLSLRDALKASGQLTIARKVWIRMAFIFAAVAIGLNMVQMFIW